MDISLHEYIHKEGITFEDHEKKNYRNGTSKFDRYKHQDEDDFDEEMEDIDEVMEKPKLVPFVPKFKINQNKQEESVDSTNSGRQPVHSRLGRRKSSAGGSIHTSRMSLYRPNFKVNSSVQNRLDKSFVNAANAERNRITLQTLATFTKKAADAINASDDFNGHLLLDAISAAVQTPAPPRKKYDMRLQKEISELQNKELFYTCPGANVVSFDGPGIDDDFKIPQNETSMTLNQRFA